MFGLTLWMACHPGSGVDSDLQGDLNDDTATPAGDSADTSTDGDTAGADTAPNDSGLFDVVFEAEVVVEAVEDGLLRLITNVPSWAADCESMSGLTCEDNDGDGLVDEWEDLVLENLIPTVRMDEQEDYFTDSAGALAAVGRVKAVDGSTVHVMVMLGYSSDYGLCGLTAHDGDSERIALSLTLAEKGVATITGAYTAAHEGDITDRSAMVSETDLGDLATTVDPTTGQLRWLVFSSEDKHATYVSKDECQGAIRVPCVTEDCAPDIDGVDTGDPVLEAYDVNFAVVNAGEDDARLVDDLTSLGFADESAWEDQEFCGGLGREGSCASSVREKLLNDPFED